MAVGRLEVVKMGTWGDEGRVERGRGVVVKEEARKRWSSSARMQAGYC